jgi:hypothetical protein
MTQGLLGIKYSCLWAEPFTRGFDHLWKKMRRFPMKKYPENKAWAGSIRMFAFIGGFIFLGSCATTSDSGITRVRKGMSKSMVKIFLHDYDQDRGDIVVRGDLGSAEEWIYTTPSGDRYSLFFVDDLLIRVREK